MIKIENYMRNSIKIHLKNRSDIVLLVVFLFSMAFATTNNYAENIVIPHITFNKQDTQKETLPLLPLPKHKPESLSSKEQSLQEDSLAIKLNVINQSTKLLEEVIEEKFNLLKKAKTEKEKINLQNEIDEINRSVAEQENSFEMIQTGGLDLEEIEVAHEKDFDWQKDLLEILQPIMSELRQLTEEKRKIFDLEKKISFYQSQIEDISNALKNMARIKKENLDKDTLSQFEQKNKKWQSRLEEYNHLLGIAQMQLNGMVDLQNERKISISDYIKEFAIGRGATFLMALAACIAVYFSLSLLWKGIMWVATRSHRGSPSYFQRVAKLVYHAIMVLFSLLTLFYVLSLRNDQVLIAIAALLLIITFWILKNSIPQYISELQLILNAGSVREGQHMVYNGIPMRVQHIGYYTKLTNPVLPNVELDLPLSQLPTHISRRYAKNEPWFPCLEGEYVILADGTYGMVKCITLENVILSLSTGIMPKTYPIKDFLDAHPKNLSQGFNIISNFGIDYKYQAESTTKIPELLRIGIQKGLLQEAYGDYLKEVTVRFALANTSSLDYRILALFDGLAASDYHSIKLDLQRYAVEVCNQQNWEIPFNQIVVHTIQD